MTSTNGNTKGSKKAKSAIKHVRPSTKGRMTVKVKGPAKISKATKMKSRAPVVIKHAAKVSKPIDSFGSSRPTQNSSLVHFAKDVEMARSVGWTSAAAAPSVSPAPAVAPAPTAAPAVAPAAAPALATMLQGKIGETTRQVPQGTVPMAGVKGSTNSSGSLFNGLMGAGILAAGTTVGVMIVGVLTGLL